MASVTFQLELPDDWQQFRLPPALNVRLQELLDKQDQQGSLATSEREEALALTELVDMLSLMKLRAERQLQDDEL